MENRYGFYSQGTSVSTSITNEEFQEEDTCGVFEERKDSDSWAMSSFMEPDFTTKRLSTATRMIPKSNKNPVNFQEPKITQHSAPVNIPDWSKIYGTTSKQDSKKACSWLDGDIQSDVDRNNDHDGFARSSWESDDEDEEDERGNIVIPPHELIARKLARNQISSFSVCEGAGRTLKGRDLSRVRNAVLTKTGFLESKPNY